MSEYLILSKKWSRAGDVWLTFWRPDNAGYCFSLECAGRYSEAAVLADPGYYDNGDSTYAVPAEMAEKHREPARIDGRDLHAVRFTARNWRNLVQAARKARTGRQPKAA